MTTNNISLDNMAKLINISALCALEIDAITQGDDLSLIITDAFNAGQDFAILCNQAKSEAEASLIQMIHALLLQTLWVKEGYSVALATELETEYEKMCQENECMAVLSLPKQTMPTQFIHVNGVPF